MFSPQNLALAAELVDNAYIVQGGQELNAREQKIRILLSQRKLPLEGWSNTTIELFLHELSIMDSNNFLANVGAGEREARIYSSLVSQRHYHMGHGIGRSGDIMAVQPKAAGSSLIYTLTNKLTLHAIKLCGILRTQNALVVPLATGMSLSLALITLKSQRPSTAKYILWPRIDQKSAFKCMITAGGEPIVIENILENHELRTDLVTMENLINSLGPENIIGVLSTTSCFAPRSYDKVQEIAILCKNYNIGHIINNAYGLQSSKICHEINEACRVGRVDAWVSSTDKNFLVPVGGAIIAGPSSKFIEDCSKMYPGRASISPILDLFITLLSMGQNGLKSLLKQRKDIYNYLYQQLTELAIKYNEKILITPNNPISIGMTVDYITQNPKYYIQKQNEDINNILSDNNHHQHTPETISTTTTTSTIDNSSSSSASIDTTTTVTNSNSTPSKTISSSSPISTRSITSFSTPTSTSPGQQKFKQQKPKGKPSTYLGSMLFSRGVSGTRVIDSSEHRTIDKYKFLGYGSQCKDGSYPHIYMTAAAAMGMTKDDVDVFVLRVEKTIKEFLKDNPIPISSESINSTSTSTSTISTTTVKNSNTE